MPTQLSQLLFVMCVNSCAVARNELVFYQSLHAEGSVSLCQRVLCNQSTCTV